MAATATAATTVTTAAHDAAYEWKAVLLLALGFGLVGLDRWIIAPLAPAIMGDLGISPQQMNNLIAVLGITWGVASIWLGGLADKWGRRKVLIPSIVIFSLASAFSGFAMGFASLFAIRALMGIAEGAFCPTSFAATADAARADRLGFAQGFQQSAFALIGLGFGPIIATQLLDNIGWRAAFMVVALPGLLLSVLLWMVIRERPQSLAQVSPGSQAHHVPLNTVGTVLGVRNVKIAMLGLLCAMCGVFVLSANTPIYLSSHLKLESREMGLVTSAIGFGGFAGLWILPALSDLFGRRVMGVIGFLGGALALVGFINTGAEPWALFGWLFAACAFSFGLFSLITGPISAEFAPPGMIATTAGLIGGAGEILGGGLALIVAGFMIATYGIQSMLYLALSGLLAGAIVMMFLDETAPRLVARRTKTSNLP